MPLLPRETESPKFEFPVSGSSLYRKRMRAIISTAYQHTLIKVYVYMYTKTKASIDMFLQP